MRRSKAPFLGTEDSPQFLESMRRARRRGLLLLVGALALCLLLSPLVGSVPVPALDVWGIIVHRATGGLVLAQPCPTLPVYIDGYSDSCSTLTLIVWDNRVPEMLVAALVGGSLGISGATMQGLFRNPLADPYLMGISGGAALGAAAVFLNNLGPTQTELFLPLFAFLGALATAAIVLLAARSPKSSPQTLLLTGVALTAIFISIISLLSSLRPNTEVLPLTFWELGSFGAASWVQFQLILSGLLVGGSVLLLQGRDLNLIQLGDETARGLGSDVDRVRRRLLLLSSLVTAVAVAFVGIIGFVGLISPHVVRRFLGPDYRLLLPLSLLFGAIFMVLADDLATSVLGGGGVLPVGVITAFVGGPFLIWVLYRRRSLGTGA